MSKFVPPGFDRAAVRAGLLQAMGFGEPNQGRDKATFVRITRTVPPGTRVDADGVPFDPDVRVETRTEEIQVPCAVQFVDAATARETFGDHQRSRVELTLLDEEYRAVEGFHHVRLGGDKYVRDFTAPPVALGSIDVWSVYCVAEDET